MIKEKITKTVVFLTLITLLSLTLNVQVNEASEKYKDIYPTLSTSEKNNISSSMFWLSHLGEFHYEKKYKEDHLVFNSMEQVHARFLNTNFDYNWDYMGGDDPLGAFRGGAHDKAAAKGVDWYLKNFWNINPSHNSNSKGDIEAYYYQGTYYKYYHNFPVMAKPTVRKLYDIGQNYYCAEYEMSYDSDWDEYTGPYYAVFKKKNVEGKTIWSAIYNQHIEESLSLDKVVKKVLTHNETAKPTGSKVLVNGKIVKFDAYNIKNNNYFKLRDLAFVLNDTKSSFEIEWDGSTNALNLVLGERYTPAGGELKIAKNKGSKKAVLSSSKMFANGREVHLTAYNIEGNNYFKLRDLGDTLGFVVDWNAKESTLIINTKDSH